MTISTRFLTCLQGLDISDREFCRRYGICRTSLHYVKTGQREAQTEWLAILVRDFGVSAHWLLVGDNCKVTCNEKTPHLQQ